MRLQLQAGVCRGLAASCEGWGGHLAFQSLALDLNGECGTECSSCAGMCNNRASIAVQGRVQYLVDKVDQIRETALLLESGTSLPCDVLVNARESKLSLIICSGCACCRSSRAYQHGSRLGGDLITMSCAQICENAIVVLCDRSPQ